MNEINWDDARGDMGNFAEDEVRRLLWHLSRSQNDNWKPPQDHAIPTRLRYAPSVVIRSEMEVFGVPAPRFALRLPVEDGRRGFVNLRRLALLKQVLEESYPCGFPLPKDGDADKYTLGVSDFDVHRTMSVADSFLSPPARYPAWKYSHVTGRLSAEFGETNPGEESGFDGSPYVRTPVFGAGLCAQACCFVSTLLRREAQRVCGLGEITALVSGNTTSLKVGGLTPGEMQTYFKKVDLGTSHQFLPKDHNEESRYPRDFEDALHGYVASKMPVILIVDMNALPSQDGHQQCENCENFGPPDVACHAVTVIGCGRWQHLRPGLLGDSPRKTGAESCFLYHDSAFMPFSLASGDELREAGMPFREEDRKGRHRAYPELLAVTPSIVKLPLLHWKDEDQTHPGPLWVGLLQLSQYPQSVDQARDFRLHRAGREFLLLQIKDVKFQALQYFDQELQEEIDLRLEPFSGEAGARLGWEETRWVWLEAGKFRQGSTPDGPPCE